MIDIGVAFALGFLGSVHCVGMCGGFALLAGVGGGYRGKRVAALVCYILGKTVTYAVLGTVLFEVVNAIPLIVTRFQAIVLGLAGAFMVLVGLHMAGFGLNWMVRVPRWASAIVSAVNASVNRSSLGGRFALGLVNGLLPCGLLYAALGYSVTMPSVLESATFMAVFGIGTAPALMLVAFGATMMSVTSRQGVYRALAWLVVVMGLITILRATPLMRMMMGSM